MKLRNFFKHSQSLLVISPSNELVTKTGGAKSEAAGDTQLSGMRHTDLHFCFGRRSRHRSPMLVACFVFAIHLF
jgi:hypothetical protein